MQTHVSQDGKILPKGTQAEVCPTYDGSWFYDGRFTYGYSERNAARAHQIDSGKWNGCWISTTRDYERARHFATSGGFADGVIYVLDESAFDGYGVVAFEDADPLYPDEKEVSIRAADGGAIPYQVIIKFETVSPG